MNYQKIYEDLIQKAKSQNRIKLKRTDPNFIYYENHHIIPISVNGVDDKENKVLLTAREHFICHKLLVRLYFRNKHLMYALWRMSNKGSLNQKRDYRIGAREYERLKIEISLMSKNRIFSEETKMKMSLSRIGIKFTEERKMKMRGILRSDEAKMNMGLAQKGRVHPQEVKDKIAKSNSGIIFSLERRMNISKATMGRKISEETKLKLFNSHIGVKLSEEHKRCISLANKGKVRSEEIRAKFSEIRKSGKVLQCPYCDVKSNNPSNMTRWHFNNCKNFGKIERNTEESLGLESKVSN